MATSGYINGVFYPNLVVCGTNISSEPNQYVLKEKEADRSLFGDHVKLLIFVDNTNTNGEFITSGYEPHRRTPEIWCCGGDYLQQKEKIQKKNRKCPHEGVEGVLGVLK